MSDKLLLELYDRVVILEEKIAKMMQILQEKSCEERETESAEEVRGKYRYLSDYLLKDGGDAIVLTFDKIEKILQDKLPQSAREHRSMWANTQTNSLSKAWYNIGYRTTDVDLQEERVVFEKVRYTMNTINYTTSKYEPLGKYLENVGKNKITLKFSEIEKILGFALPKYLYQYVAGWYGTAEGSPTHRQKAVWNAYGYQVESVNLYSETVVFYKI